MLLHVDIITEKIILKLVKDDKEDFSQETTGIGFCNRGERSGSTPNIIWKSGNLEPRSRV